MKVCTDGNTSAPFDLWDSLFVLLSISEVIDPCKTVYTSTRKTVLLLVLECVSCLQTAHLSACNCLPYFSFASSSSSSKRYFYTERCVKAIILNALREKGRMIGFMCSLIKFIEWSCYQLSSTFSKKALLFYKDQREHQSKCRKYMWPTPWPRLNYDQWGFSHNKQCTAAGTAHQCGQNAVLSSPIWSVQPHWTSTLTSRAT